MKWNQRLIDPKAIAIICPAKCGFFIALEPLGECG
jgi:hypothetical protein